MAEDQLEQRSIILQRQEILELIEVLVLADLQEVQRVVDHHKEKVTLHLELILHHHQAAVVAAVVAVAEVAAVDLPVAEAEANQLPITLFTEK